MNLGMTAVYKIKNTVTGKLYIGQSVNPNKRYARHFWKNSGCTKLKNAIQKYGKAAFIMEIIHWCYDKQEANELETFLILECGSIRNGYNITPGGDGAGSGKDNPFYGRKHSDATKALLASKRIGKPMPAVAREKIKVANTGRLMREETKEKLRARPKSEFCSLKTAEANRARVWTEESKNKLRKFNLGKNVSAETKVKIGLANSNRVWTEEAKTKISEAAKARHKRNRALKALPL